MIRLTDVPTPRYAEDMILVKCIRGYDARRIVHGGTYLVRKEDWERRDVNSSFCLEVFNLPDGTPALPMINGGGNYRVYRNRFKEITE